MSRAGRSSGPSQSSGVPSRRLAPDGSRPTDHRLSESVITAFVTGLTSTLPAATLLALEKPSWTVLVSIPLTCIAVCIGSYGFIYGRRNARLANQLGTQSSQPIPSLPATANLRVDEKARSAHTDLAHIVFMILWNRAVPGQPMNPMALAQMVTERSPEVAGTSGPAEIVRAVEEIRLLRRLPTLERSRDGFFLNSDDFRLNRNLALESKRQIAFAAATYIRPGMSVALDGGSTTLHVAQVLASRIVAKTLDGLCLTTSSIQMCAELLGVQECREAIESEDLKVWSMAGPLHPSCWTVDPPKTEQCPWPLDLAIIGANGIVNDGFYLPNTDGFEVKRTFIRTAPMTLIVADSSKVGRQLSERFATWNENVKLITNRPSEAATRRCGCR